MTIEYKYYSPAPINKTKQEIFILAQKFSNKYDFNFMNNIDSFIHKIGGQINYYQASSNDRYFTIIHAKNDFVIRIPKFLGLERTRFVLAHELGHYVLHSNFGKKQILSMFFDRNEADIEANWFAAGLLMPEKDFVETCKKYNNDHNQIAARYLVSPQAVKMRVSK